MSKDKRFLVDTTIITILVSGWIGLVNGLLQEGTIFGLVLKCFWLQFNIKLVLIFQGNSHIEGPSLVFWSSRVSSAEAGAFSGSVQAGLLGFRGVLGLFAAAGVLGLERLHRRGSKYPTDILKQTAMPCYTFYNAMQCNALLPGASDWSGIFTQATAASPL